MRQVLAYALIWLTCLGTPARAQEEDESGGFLVEFLEDNLSGENSQIEVIGLEGAFSSQATIKQLTVSDDDGIWLTINDAVLDWNRLALVRGRFSVNALTAKEIILSRPPTPVAAELDLPDPEAQPFQLPDLPVAIELGKISVERLELGEPVLGVKADLELTGALKLAEGALDTNLNILRQDRAGDAVFLVAKFENVTSLITLDLAVTEEHGGLIAAALKIPDSPPLRLVAQGVGPITDFTAQIDLSTDGINRVSGQVRLQEVAAVNRNDTENSEPPKTGISFTADLAGDVTPLLATEYHQFFGTSTRFELAGQRDADGRLELREFNLASDALALHGALNIAASGDVEKVELDGQITPISGSQVVLPIPGAHTAISNANVTARLDAAASDSWDLDLSLENLTRPDMRIGQAKITANGTLQPGDPLKFHGAIKAALNGMAFDDTALAQAVGDTVSLNGKFAVQGQGPLELSDFTLAGSDYTAALGGQLQGLESGFRVEGTARIGAADLSRFSGLTGQTLGGAVTATVTGNGVPLGGQFDFQFDARTDGLSSGIAQVDPLIGGQTILSMDAERSTAGLKVNSFKLEGEALSAHASGSIASGGSDLVFDAKLDDLSRVLEEVSGPLQLRGNVRQDQGGTLSALMHLNGPDSSFVDLTGTFEPDNGSAALTYTAELDRVERFFPEMKGSIKARGTAERTVQRTVQRTVAHSGAIWQIDTDAKAKADFTAQISGTWDETSGRADLGVVGEIQMAVANKLLTPNSIIGLASFDLALKGQPGLPALSGTITTNGAKFALPGLAQTIENINTTVTLKDEQATLAMTANLAAGGAIRVNGPVALAPPFNGTITTDLQQIVLTDNISYRSIANGQLVFAGPLTGNANLSGRIDFGETEINLNTASGSLGAAPIPLISHRNEPRNVQSTRDRAGLIETGPSSAGPAIGLDIILSAPGHVFARGRGLQAELGGEIAVHGTTHQVVPAGQIELIRGTMNLLGRKLKLSKGLVTLQGKLEPYIEFAATTTTSEGAATIEIAGPLGAPKVEVFSDPERPSEEALAMLVFGNRFASMSPLAIAQMAASLAELSGSGGSTLGKAREELGVDALDVGADEGGNGQVGVGFYVLDNVYTDFTVNTQGDTELNLNLDVSDNLTVKGTVDNAGTTSVGLFFERDY